MSTEAEIHALLVPFVAVERPDQPLRLESIEIAMLLEAIEDTFDLTLRARDYDAKAFTRVDALVAWVESLL